MKGNIAENPNEQNIMWLLYEQLFVVGVSSSEIK